VVDSEQDGRIFILNEAFDVPFHLLDDAPVVEHAQCAHNRAPFGEVVPHRQSCLGSRRARGNYQLREGKPRSNRLCPSDNQEEP
jgi:hypothetical protein